VLGYVSIIGASRETFYRHRTRYKQLYMLHDNIYIYRKFSQSKQS